MSKTNGTNHENAERNEATDSRARPHDEFDELLATIEEERATKLRAEANRLREEAYQLSAQVDVPGERKGVFREVKAGDLVAWQPTEEEGALLDEADRLHEEAQRLEDEAKGYLPEEEASRLEAEEAQHLASNPKAALAYMKVCLSRALPYNLRRYVLLLEAPSKLEPEELEELRTEAADGYREALYLARSILTADAASNAALDTYLPTASAAEKDEVRCFLVDLLVRELSILAIRRELEIRLWDELDPKEAERGQREFGPTIAAFADRHGLGGLTTVLNVLLGQATPEDVSEIKRLATAEPEIFGPAARVGSRTLAEIEAKRTSWLLPGRLARSEITMVNGWPGAGKTSAIVDMVARLSRGEGLPGDPNVRPQRTLYLGTEDRPETLRLRFQAAGGNLDMIHVPTESELDHLRLPSGEEEWKRHLRTHRIGVVVLDPLMGLIDDNLKAIGEQHMRTYMRSLRNAIESTRTAVFGIRHPNKASAGGNMLAIASASNSLALTAAARLELLIAGVPGDDGDLRAMATVKNNLSADAPTLGFGVKGVLVKLNDGGPPESVAAVQWSGELDLDANDLMRRKDPRTVGASAAAEAFLRTFLEDHPRLKSEVVAAGKERGIKQRTLQRTIARIGYSDGKKHKPGATWGLKETHDASEPPADLSDMTEEPVRANPGPDPLVQDKPFTESGNGPPPDSESSEEEAPDA